MIYIDRQIFFLQPLGGISTYTKQLIDEFMPIHNDAVRGRVAGLGSIQKDLLRLGQSGDVVHHSYHFPLFVPKNVKRVATIYDLALERGFLSSSRSTLISMYLKRRLIESADAIIAISKATMNDAEEFYPEILNKPQRVIFLSANKTNKSNVSEVALQVTNKPFFLFVGKRHGYKNFHTILEAFKKSCYLRKEFCLLAVGGEALSLTESKAKEELGSSFEHIPIINDGELSRLYKDCEAYVSASFIEGFGLPVLEALSHGARCICSDIPVYRELFSGSVEFFTANCWESFEEASRNPVLGSASILDRFSKSRMLNAHKAFYSEIS